MSGRLASESTRAALTLRGIERQYGLGRAFVSGLVRQGRLPSIRRGRSILVLRGDVERLWRSMALAPEAPTDHVRQRVAEVLARESSAPQVSA